MVIRFTPDSLADYNDELLVTTSGEEQQLHVALTAHRPPPKLTLPEVRPCHVCCAVRMHVRFTVYSH